MGCFFHLISIFYPSYLLLYLILFYPMFELGVVPSRQCQTVLSSAYMSHRSISGDARRKRNNFWIQSLLDQLFLIIIRCPIDRWCGYLVQPCSKIGTSRQCGPFEEAITVIQNSDRTPLPGSRTRLTRLALFWLDNEFLPPNVVHIIDWYSWILILNSFVIS